MPDTVYCQINALQIGIDERDTSLLNITVTYTLSNDPGTTRVDVFEGIIPEDYDLHELIQGRAGTIVFT